MPSENEDLKMKYAENKAKIGLLEQDIVRIVHELAALKNEQAQLEEDLYVEHLGNMLLDTKPTTNIDSIPDGLTGEHIEFWKMANV